MTPRATRPSAVCALAGAIAAVAGCGGGMDDARGEHAARAPSAASPAAPVPDPTGIWTVAGHIIPGVSALGDSLAAAHHGKTLRLTEEEAVFDGARCEGPAYATHTTSADSLLGGAYHLAPGSVAPLAARERVTVLDVTCAGAAWAAPGGRLIEVDTAHALAPWDGVFYELVRDHDFRGLGQEPFWSLLVRKGRDIRFTYAVGEREVLVPAPVAHVDAATGATVYHAATEASDLTVRIAATPCTDVMSGREFEATVDVVLNGDAYHGCGEPVAP